MRYLEGGLLKRGRRILDGWNLFIKNLVSKFQPSKNKEVIGVRTEEIIEEMLARAGVETYLIGKTAIVLEDSEITFGQLKALLREMREFFKERNVKAVSVRGAVIIRFRSPAPDWRMSCYS